MDLLRENLLLLDLVGSSYLPPLETPYGILLISHATYTLFIFVDYPKFKWSLRPNIWGIKIENDWMHYEYEEINNTTKPPIPYAFDMMRCVRSYLTIWSMICCIGRTIIHNGDYSAANIIKKYKQTNSIELWMIVGDQ